MQSEEELRGPGKLCGNFGLRLEFSYDDDEVVRHAWYELRAPDGIRLLSRISNRDARRPLDFCRYLRL